MSTTLQRPAGPPAPDFWVRHLLALAVWLLPASQRYRYRQEFLAELYGLPRHRQYASAWSLATHVLALRAAVSDLSDGKDTTMKTRTPLACRVNHHSWHGFSTEDGGRFRRCTRCGRDYVDRYNGGGVTGFGGFA
jgi:hypothetical protein